MKKTFITISCVGVLGMSLLACAPALATSVHSTYIPITQNQSSIKAQQSNLLVNGDFETGDATGWDFSGTGPTAKFTVVQHLRSLQGHMYDGGTLLQRVNVNAGSTYNLSMDFNQLYSGYDITLTLTALDSNGNRIADVYSKTSRDVKGTFTKNDIELPDNTKTVEVKISTMINSEAYVDNISLTSNAQTGLINGDFETGDKTGWDFTTDNISARFEVDQRDGSYQGRIYDGGVLSQRIVANEGEKYKFSMDYTQASLMYSIYVRVSALDAQGKKIEDVYTQRNVNSGGTFSSNSIVAPEGTTYLQVAIYTPYASDYYIDNVVLEPIA